MAMAYFVSACMTGLTALDEKPAVRPSTTGNMTTPNQLMDASSRLYSERFVDDDHETRCAFEGCSSSRYGRVCKVGFDQFCCKLDEL